MSKLKYNPTALKIFSRQGANISSMLDSIHNQQKKGRTDEHASYNPMP